MHLEMSVSKILTHRHLWYFKTIKLYKWLQTWFILLHLVLDWNVRVKSIWTHSAPPIPFGSNRPDIRIQEICINFCEQQVLPLSCTISTVEKGLTLESKIQTTVRIFILQTTCSWHPKTKPRIPQFTNLKCCIKARQPFKIPFLRCITSYLLL